MDSFNEKLFYDKVAENIKSNINQINDILQNCSIETKFATIETQEKFQNIFNLEPKNLLRNESSEYYDLNELSSILEMLDENKSNDGNKKLKFRAESISSFSSLSSLQSSKIFFCQCSDLNKLNSPNYNNSSGRRR